MTSAEPVPEASATPLVNGGCGRISRVLARTDDKWSVLTVMLLTARPHRFNETKRSVGGISQRMLTLTLKELERDGLVWRTVHPTVPPRVEYGLTELGVSLADPVRAPWASGRVPTPTISTRLARSTRPVAAADHRSECNKSCTPPHERRLSAPK